MLTNLHCFADMIFDDDAKLLGLFARYQEETDELKAQILHYITSDTFDEPMGQVQADMAEQNTNGSSDLNEVSGTHLFFAFEKPRNLTVT